MYIQQSEMWKVVVMANSFSQQPKLIVNYLSPTHNVTTVEPTSSPAPEAATSEFVTVEPTISFNNSITLEEITSTLQPEELQVSSLVPISEKLTATRRSAPYTTHEEFVNDISKYVFHYHPPSGKTSTKYLFIVNFHWSKYRESVFISHQYFKKFSTYFNSSFDMVMVGPSKNPKYRVLSNGLPQGGFYSYYSMPFVYDLLCNNTQPCNYNGYFFMNDDSYVDAQLLNNYDLTQSWGENFVTWIPNRSSWGWPNVKNRYGKPFKNAYFNAMKELIATNVGKQCRFEKQYTYKRGWSDAFYLTARDVGTFNEIVRVMYKHGVFLEMATPTALWCLTQNTFDNCNHGKMQNRLTCVHLHPMKYRQGNRKKMALERLDHINMDIVPRNKY